MYNKRFKLLVVVNKKTNAGIVRVTETLQLTVMHFLLYLETN